MRFYCFAAALLVSRLLVAQTTSTPITPVIGTVLKSFGHGITVESGQRIITVFTNERTEVWKGKVTHDLSMVQVGDRFSGRCRADSSGRIVAVLIELNVVKHRNGARGQCLWSMNGAQSRVAVLDAGDAHQYRILLKKQQSSRGDHNDL